MLVCVHFFLHPSPELNVPTRTGSAIAILVIYFILLLSTAVSYFRVGSIVLTDPGYLPKGTPCPAATKRFVKDPPPVDVFKSCTCTTVGDKQATRSYDEARASSEDSTKSGRPGDSGGGKEKQRHGKTHVKEKKPLGQTLTSLEIEAIFRGDLPPPPGLEQYYSKEMFVCDPNGLPLWCGSCNNWKPDRSHHCSDVGRCCLKLDHFCPWVGGVVAERNFKFFIQFTGYTAVYTAFILIVMAYSVAELKRNGFSTGQINVHWIVVLGLAALFFVFTGGMVGKALQDASNNLTTIDAIDHGRRTMFLACHIDSRVKPASDATTNASRQTRGGGLIPWQGTITYPLYTRPESMTAFSLPNSTAASAPPRTFAIVRTPPGMSPWNLGKLGNIRAVMGTHWYDWFLPLKFSPCCDHDRGDSFYALGPELEQLKLDAGILTGRASSRAGSQSTQRRRRHRKPRRSSLNSVRSMETTLANVDGSSGLDGQQRAPNLQQEGVNNGPGD